MLHLHKKTGGGGLDGDARRSPRRMDTEALWEGKGKPDSGPIGLEIGDSSKEGEVSGRAWNEEILSLLIWFSSFRSLPLLAIGSLSWYMTVRESSIGHPLSWYHEVCLPISKRKPKNKQTCPVQTFLHSSPKANCKVPRQKCLPGFLLGQYLPFLSFLHSHTSLARLLFAAQMPTVDIRSQVHWMKCTPLSEHKGKIRCSRFRSQERN